MYGTKRQRLVWHDEYSETLAVLGFVRGDASACVVIHRERRLASSVHGDDFTSLGARKELDIVEETCAAQFEIKIRGA